LELALAQANGALDVLRGRGVPGTLNIKGTFDARSVYSYLDVVAYNGASWCAKEISTATGLSCARLARVVCLRETHHRAGSSFGGYPAAGASCFLLLTRHELA
jgi:hypothetical protein